MVTWEEDCGCPGLVRFVIAQKQFEDWEKLTRIKNCSFKWFFPILKQKKHC
jgi:hypothetical protein